MPRGRKKGFKHSEETKEKMKGKRKPKEDSDAFDEDGNDLEVEEPIEVPAVQ